MDIKFEYLYRDARNNKKRGEIIVSNIDNISNSIIERMIRNSLIDDDFFIASKSKLPRLEFENFNKKREKKRCTWGCVNIDIAHWWSERISQ
jgi:hypothetical protein